MLIHLIPSGLDPKIDKEHVQGGGLILRRPRLSHRMLYEQAQGLMKERKVDVKLPRLGCPGSDEVAPVGVTSPRGGKHRARTRISWFLSTTSNGSS